MKLVYLRRCFVVLFFLAVRATTPALAQDTPGPPTPSAPVIEPDDSTTTTGLNPRTAFIRSMIVPGWGQFSVGAEKRGIVFVALQGASWYMLVKTHGKLGKARDREETRFGFLTDSLTALIPQDSALKNPVEFNRRIDADSTLALQRALVASREEQRQDWIATTIAITLAGAVDAYVAAHLADFPAVIVPRPNGALQLQVNVPLKRRP